MTFARVDMAHAAANIKAMVFVVYLVGLVAAFVGVAMLYGTLMKPFTVSPRPPLQEVVEEKADPAITQSTRRRDAASEARAEADRARRTSRGSRHSPVRSEPDELRLKPERCWIVTDKTRNYGYYGACR